MDIVSWGHERNGFPNGIQRAASALPTADKGVVGGQVRAVPARADAVWHAPRARRDRQQPDRKRNPPPGAGPQELFVQWLARCRPTGRDAVLLLCKLQNDGTKPLGMAPRCASTGGQPPHKPHRGAPTRELQNGAIDLGGVYLVGRIQ
jgi:hypothetical protein